MDTAHRLLLTAAFTAPLSGFAQDLPKGEIVERSGLPADSTQTYALYLPSSYDPARSWPVIYALDPAARGRVPLERFKSAAETYGYILAGSNDSRNGPLQPSLRSLMAITADVRQRFTVDRQRVYLAGFFRRARAASVFVEGTADSIAGLVACGAGLATELTPRDLGPAYFLGIVGTADFNYQEMRELDRRMTSEQVGHRVFVTDGRHDWPDEQTCTRAVEWLEMQAMATGLRPRDPALLDAVYGKETELARALEAQGDAVGAALAYQGMVAVFGDLRGDDVVAQALARLKNGEPTASSSRRRTSATEGAGADAGLPAGPGHALPRPACPGRLGRGAEGHGGADLVRQVRKADLPDSQLARRLLNTWRSVQEQGQRAMEKNEFRRAGLFFEVGSRATEVNPRAQANFLYEMACRPGRGRRREEGAGDAAQSHRERLRRPRGVGAGEMARGPAQAARVRRDPEPARCFAGGKR